MIRFYLLAESKRIIISDFTEKEMKSQVPNETIETIYTCKKESVDLVKYKIILAHDVNETESWMKNLINHQAILPPLTISSIATENKVESPVKRGRGRPRKIKSD